MQQSKNSAVLCERIHFQDSELIFSKQNFTEIILNPPISRPFISYRFIFILPITKSRTIDLLLVAVHWSLDSRLEILKDTQFFDSELMLGSQTSLRSAVFLYLSLYFHPFLSKI